MLSESITIFCTIIFVKFYMSFIFWGGGICIGALLILINQSDYYHFDSAKMNAYAFHIINQNYSVAINHFSSFLVWPEGNQESCNEVGSQFPDELYKKLPFYSKKLLIFLIHRFYISSIYFISFAIICQADLTIFWLGGVKITRSAPYLKIYTFPSNFAKFLCLGGARFWNFLLMSAFLSPNISEPLVQFGWITPHWKTIMLLFSNIMHKYYTLFMWSFCRHQQFFINLTKMSYQYVDLSRS